jgi:hypothetical protein
MKSSIVAMLAVSVVSLVISLISPRCALGTGFLLVSPAMRSQGMGSVGVADDTDPANAFFNPAAIASTRGAFLTLGYNSFTYDYGLESDVNTYTYNVGAGAGFERALGDDITGRFGVGVRYNAFSREESFAYSTPHNDDEDYVSFALGVGCAMGDALYGGVGLAVKPWREKYGYPPPETSSKTAYDIGFLARMQIIRTEKMTLSSSYGVSFLNLGGTISRNYPLPKTYRYGFALHFEGENSGYCREHFCVDVPVLAASMAFDFIDGRPQGGNDWGLGAEVALYQILFLRTGYTYLAENATYWSFGLGVGFTFQRFSARFDIADVGQVLDSSYTDKYGLSLGFNY